jgi:hypothetical protein
MKAWHFDVAGDPECGTKYGSCGLNKGDAMERLQNRLREDGSKGKIVRAEAIGDVNWDYPTVICYR